MDCHLNKIINFSSKFNYRSVHYCVEWIYGPNHPHNVLIIQLWKKEIQLTMGSEMFLLHLDVSLLQEYTKHTVWTVVRLFWSKQGECYVWFLCVRCFSCLRQWSIWIADPCITRANAARSSGNKSYRLLTSFWAAGFLFFETPHSLWFMKELFHYVF